MPASLRAHGLRATSSRPYDRHAPTASPVQSEISQFSPSAPASPIPAPHTDQLNQVVDAESDVPPDRPGLPTYAEYKCIEAGYLRSLSPRKRDKALITQVMFDKIWDVLHQPEACTIETPQFRFWVRKMFTLSRSVDAGDDGSFGFGVGWSGGEECSAADADPNEADLELEHSMGIGRGRATADEPGLTAVVLHENRPVAIMEQLYELFCYCHVRAGHGGRDKTCAVIREHYSWVPKELTAQFVKACPTCVLKRSGQGIDVAALRGVAGSRGRKGRAMPLEVGAEETPASMGTLSLGWPTTGGPLDPANPEPCGVPPSNPVSPALGSRMHPVPGRDPLVGGWNNTLRALTLGASPFSACNTIPRPPDLPFPLNTTTTRHGGEENEKRSPIKGLQSLGSVLLNKSLDEHVRLTGRAGPSDGAEYLLPSALRPLRLVGPGIIPSDTESELARPFQIDPVLLSFNYPGLGSSSESGFVSDAGADPASFGLTTGPGMPSGGQGSSMTSLPGQSLYRLCDPLDVSMSMNLPALDLSRGSDSPDSSFERAVTADGAAAAALPFSLSMELMGQSRCGSRHGCRDGALAIFHSCSADEMDHELDGAFSFSITMDM